MDLDDIKASLKERADELARYLFPQGKRAGREWQVGDVHGSPGNSFSICIQGIKAGLWADFSTGDKGTLLDLWAMHHGYHGADKWVTRAGEECAAWLGGTFEKRGAPEPVRTSNNGNRDKRAQDPVPKPNQRPTPRTKVPPMPKLPAYTLEWDQAVEAFNDAAADALQKQRGYSAEFVEWLKQQKLIGLVPTRHGDALALPVHDEDGAVIAAHVRNRQKRADGTPIEPAPPRWQYFFHGETSPGTRPLIIGDVSKATKIWVFESQWDAFAVIDRIGLHSPEVEWPPVAIFITRGAANGRLVSRVAAEGKTLVLWPQNDEPDNNGKIAAEEWTKSILEVAGNIPCRRVRTPEGYEDPNDWLKQCPPPAVGEESSAHRVDVRKLLEAISQAEPARESKLPPVRDMAFAIKPENRTPVPPEVIKGLLHRGSKLIVGGTSKGRKSFSLIDMAVSVSSGQPWWGFPTERGRVLYLNFEIQTPFLEIRTLDIVNAKKVLLTPGTFHTMTLRGNTEQVENLAQSLIDYVLQLEPYALIVFDPIYKLMSGRDENKAGDVTAVLAQLEKVSVLTGAAIAFGAHYSKGNQAAKESIDRIGGSGAFARDPDAILTMTAHEQADSFTVEPTLRNFAPVEPFVVTWQWPLFHRDTTGLDPAALKMPKGKGEKESGSRVPAANPVRKNDALIPALEMLVKVYGNATPRNMHWSQMLAGGTSQCGISEATAKKYGWRLRDEGYITSKERGLWQTTEKGDAYVDANTPEEEAAPAEPEQIGIDFSKHLQKPTDPNDAEASGAQ